MSQLATSSVQSPRSPSIPPELISLILTKLWEEPLSSVERSTSLKNIVLVNHTWLTLVAPIASRDVHIFDIRKAKAFMARIPKHPFHKGLFSSEASRFANEICRSLTFHVNGNASHGDLSKDTPAFWDCCQTNVAISNVLYRVNRLHWLPNLRHISFRYTDWAYDDVLEQMAWERIPKQVTHLSVDYSFTAPASAPAFESATILRWSDRRHRRHFLNIRHLSLSGMTTAFVAVMLRVCPNVETLEIAHPAQLPALAPLPLTVRTLVLCHPGVAVSRKTMAAWRLDTALDARLFPEGTKPWIVVRSGTPDPVAFTRLRHTCKCFNVELVYERDDSRSRAC